MNREVSIYINRSHLDSMLILSGKVAPPRLTDFQRKKIIFGHNNDLIIQPDDVPDMGRLTEIVIGIEHCVR